MSGRYFKLNMFKNYFLDPPTSAPPAAFVNGDPISHASQAKRPGIILDYPVFTCLTLHQILSLPPSEYILILIF